MVCTHKLTDRCGVGANVAYFKRNTSLREVSLYPGAGWSAILAVYHNFFLGHAHLNTKIIFAAARIQKLGPTLTYKSDVHTYSISNSILAVFCSICETEQYFSSESRTASSIAFRLISPPTE